MNYVPANKKNIKIYEIIAVTALLITALALRLYKIGYFGLWLDEAATVYLIKSNIYIFDSSPPLYYLFMKSWCFIFGYSEFALRFPSVIFSIIALAFLYFFVKKAFGQFAAFFSLAFGVFSPFLINYAQEARAYSLLMMLFIMNLYYFYCLIFISNNKQRLQTYGYIVTGILLLYTHYSAFFILLSQILFLLACPRDIKLNYWIKRLLIIGFFSFGSVIIFLWNYLYKRVGTWIPDFSLVSLTGTLNCFSGGNLLIPKTIFSITALTQTFLISFSVFFTFLAVIYLQNDKEILYRKRIFFVLFFLVTPLSLSILISAFFVNYYSVATIKYVSFLIFPYIVLLSIGITRLITKVPIVISMLIIILLFSLIPYYQSGKLYGEDWNYILPLIENKMENNTKIVAFPSYITLAVNYYAPNLTTSTLTN